jgi:hypothetical protein
MNLVDDATGTTLSYMAKEETTEAAMRVLWAWVKRYGVPAAVYCDQKSVYITDRQPTLQEQLAEVEPMTAFGEACRKLGVPDHHRLFPAGEGSCGAQPRGLSGSVREGNATTWCAEHNGGERDAGGRVF